MRRLALPSCVTGLVPGAPCAVEARGAGEPGGAGPNGVRRNSERIGGEWWKFRRKIRKPDAVSEHLGGKWWAGG